jgi:hypothetical protein
MRLGCVYLACCLVIAIVLGEFALHLERAPVDRKPLFLFVELERFCGKTKPIKPMPAKMTAVRKQQRKPHNPIRATTVRSSYGCRIAFWTVHNMPLAGAFDVETNFRF